MTRQRGIALLTVLIIMASLTLVTASVTALWRKHFDITLGLLTQQQAMWNLRGAETLFIQSINTSDVKSSWSGSIWLDDEEVQWQLSDAQACFNLNSLLPVGRTMGNGTYHMPAARQVFVHLLMQSGMKEESAAHFLSGLLLLVKKHVDDPPLTSFVDTSQVYLVDGADPDALARVVPLLCVLPEPRLLVSLNGLSRNDAGLLSALFMGEMSVHASKQLLDKRPPQGWSSFEEIIALLSSQDERKLFTQVTTLSTLSSDHYELLQWTSDAPDYRLKSRIMRVSEKYVISSRFRE